MITGFEFNSDHLKVIYDMDDDPEWSGPSAEKVVAIFMSKPVPPAHPDDGSYYMMELEKFFETKAFNIKESHQEREEDIIY